MAPVSLGEGCRMSETVVAEGRTEVDAANRRFMEAFERGDAASVAALYTEDAVVLPPDGPMISGVRRSRSSGGD
jgi:ketosteroid isomerase-like protein